MREEVDARSRSRLLLFLRGEPYTVTIVKMTVLVIEPQMIQKHDFYTDAGFYDVLMFSDTQQNQWYENNASPSLIVKVKHLALIFLISNYKLGYM